ncbi:hypothetical protein [Mesorhizobium sp. M4B.F.Ca.ET.058.02.1.1]|uniref:hypothetical protein n=1 Tax=Mesorhizobium sp. M4B.F.Ca.ET.058.02.1.1 TaxID=2493675 RepID=UPI000F74D22F|nr:hypothetical protein [Mesorhizobium sp. M4B.F.Ca.ET.058.02.1.1]AZO48058.1 hypothetical protein EJ073_09685 [Mesorhizobium sp. M4B.F.Ca.ET.058.02.1.1]
MAEIVDFRSKKIERIEASAEVIVEKLPDDTIMECSVCNNKAFTLITNSAEDATFPGFDVVCTACDTIIDMSEDAE